MLMLSRTEQAQMAKARHEAVLIQRFARSNLKTGRIACPVCGTGKVRAERLPNGGTRGQCETAGCVEWTA